MTKLRVTFRNFANAPKNDFFLNSIKQLIFMLDMQCVYMRYAEHFSMNWLKCELSYRRIFLLFLSGWHKVPLPLYEVWTRPHRELLQADSLFAEILLPDLISRDVFLWRCLWSINCQRLSLVKLMICKDSAVRCVYTLHRKLASCNAEFGLNTSSDSEEDTSHLFFM
jgi:hypothetical protein